MTLAKMLEEERKKAAIRIRTYSVAEQFAIVELVALRIIRQERNLDCLGVQERIRKLVADAKLSTSYPALDHLDDIFFSLARAGHLSDIEWSEDTHSREYDNEHIPTVSKKGRSYMLGMPKTVQNAATRLMQPYTVLDRIAAAIPKIPKTEKKRRKRRRRRS